MSLPDRQKLQRELTWLGLELGTTELSVLLRLGQRLKQGQRSYGSLNLPGDKRDWAEEATQEALDLAIYLGIKLEAEVKQ